MKHLEVAHKVVDFLHESYPDSSIALGGSVAEGLFSKDSDIDILFMKASITGTYLITFEYEGLEVTLFIISKQHIYQNYQKYLYGYHNMPLTFISSSRLIYDSFDLIKGLRKYFNDIIQRRGMLRTMLVDNLKNEILEICNIDHNECMEKKKSVFMVCNRLVELFYLAYYPYRITTKSEGRNPFIFLKKSDYILYNFIRKILPYSWESYPILKKEINDMLENISKERRCQV